MISFVTGTVSEITEEGVVLDRDGLGVFVYTTAIDRSRLPMGNDVRLHTYLKVAEDELSLYGFLDRDALSLYRMLLGVNGVGPKAALSILGAMTPDTLRFAIAAEDAKAISAAPGVGAKTAQRIILDLRDRVGALFSDTGDTSDRTALAAAEGDRARQETIEALVALGYSATEAMKALKEIDPEGKDTSEILPLALRKLSIL